MGIYSWNPQTGELSWDDRLRAKWGLHGAADVDMDVFQSAIHPDDRPRVNQAITDCTDPDGTGLYSVEYRVIGRDDGVIRHIATKGQTTFADGRAIGFIGAAIDVSRQRQNEQAVRSSEALFRSFADHSSNLIWIGDPSEDSIVYRSAAYEAICGQSCDDGADSLADWIKDVHEDDRDQVKRALDAVAQGEVTKFDYRLVHPRMARCGNCTTRAFRSLTRTAPFIALPASPRI
ncbi:PAS domain-containing protein [Devosia aurantiaca]|uniref:PAS domain-containing protein n=1 Tax=Devosia aurantiaca TaxID=2714858 RepID=UPI002E2BE9F1|nr:PAS domain-containing protein [Devosia aurantiaca]